MTVVFPALIVMAVRRSAQTRLKKGHQFLERGKLVKAEQIFRSLIAPGQWGADQEEAYYWLGQSLEQRNAVNEAITTYQRYLTEFDVTGRGSRRWIRAIRRRLHELERERSPLLALRQLPDGSIERPTRALPRVRIRESNDESSGPLIRVTEAGERRSTESGSQPRIDLIPRTASGRHEAPEGVQSSDRYSGLDPESAHRVVGRYLLGDKLGEGGFGEVYEAFLPVAIKVAKNPALVDNLRKLGVLQGKVKSPYIVAPLEIDLEADPPYVVMEHVDGPTMRGILRRHERLRPVDAVAVIHQIAMGLRDAHSAGVLHLDLKPENVLFTSSGQVKITDFELGCDQTEASRFRLNQSMVSITEDGVQGTIAYMAPEQRSGKEVDERSDIYTIGVMLFEALTGELPQPGDKLGEFVEGVPAEVERIIERCYTRHERRYASAKQLAFDLEKALAFFPEQADLAGLVRGVPSERQRAPEIYEPEVQGAAASQPSSSLEERAARVAMAPEPAPAPETIQSEAPPARRPSLVEMARRLGASPESPPAAEEPSEATPEPVSAPAPAPRRAPIGSLIPRPAAAPVKAQRPGIDGAIRAADAAAALEISEPPAAPEAPSIEIRAREAEPN